MFRTTISILLFLLLFSGPSYTQVLLKIDSLHNLLETSSPEDKVSIFCEISELYWQRSYDTSLYMAILARNTASEIGHPELSATSLYMVGNAYYLLGDYPGSMDNYLQALEIWEKLGDSSNIASTYNNMGAVYLRMDDEQKALQYFEKSGNIFRALNDDMQLFERLGIKAI